MDVKTTFLSGELYKEIWMRKKWCRLVKPLYGLKWVPKQRNEKLDNAVILNGFRINVQKMCVCLGYEFSINE